MSFSNKTKTIARGKKALLGSISIVIMTVGLILGPVLQAPVYADHHSVTALKWISQIPAGNSIWQSVIWRGDPDGVGPLVGQFVAVATAAAFPFANNTKAMTSPDGITWTLLGGTLPTSRPWTSVTWSPTLNLFVAVACHSAGNICATASGASDRIMTSPDGTNWTLRTASEGSTWQSVTWGGDPDGVGPLVGQFVAVADAGAASVMTSPDGITWTSRTASEANAWRSVTWSPALNLFVAVAGSGTNRVMTSSDGITWTAQSAAEANNWQEVTWSPELGKFVAVASDGTNRVMTSSDGVTWTPQTVPAVPDASAWSSVTWSPGQGFVAVASTGTNRSMTSPDGVTWTAGPAAADNAWNSVVWSSELNKLVAVGSIGTNTTRVMTSTSTITAVTNEATNVDDVSATLHGDYQDAFPGANVFFRYRLAGSSDPFVSTAPQAVVTSGPLNASIAGLNPSTEYEFKTVVQWSSNGTRTLEGGLQTFTTLQADDDNDGVANVIEDAGPNGGDANDDGTPDSIQSNVVNFVNSVNGQRVALEVAAACQINAASMSAESINPAQDQAFEYPVGLMNFTIDCGTPGFVTDVIHFHYGVSGDFAFRKYNPNDDTYFAIDGAVLEQTSIGGEPLVKATFETTDGGLLDMDETADGNITDPAGLAVLATATTPPGGLAATGQNTGIITAIAELFVLGSLIIFSKKKEIS